MRQEANYTGFESFIFDKLRALADSVPTTPSSRAATREIAHARPLSWVLASEPVSVTVDCS